MTPPKSRSTPPPFPPVFRNETAGDPASFAGDLERLYFYAEMRFQQDGGGKCSVCNAHVRHVLEVTSFRPDGQKVFRCLCTRCLVAEEARSSRVVLSSGGMAVESHRPAIRRAA